MANEPEYAPPYPPPFLRPAKPVDEALVLEAFRLMDEEGLNKNQAVRKACRGSGTSATTLFKWIREGGWNRR